MTALLEKVLSQVAELSEPDQEAIAARMLSTLEEFTQEKNRAEIKPRPQFGSAKGMFTLAPDFDAPLPENVLTVPHRKAGTAGGTYWMSANFDDALRLETGIEMPVYPEKVTP